MKTKRILIYLLLAGILAYMTWWNMSLEQENKMMKKDLDATMELVWEQAAAIKSFKIENQRLQEDNDRLQKELGNIYAISDVRITHYCMTPGCKICGGGGNTASGTPVREGVVAVDPRVIPLGSTVIIDGKEYLAEDTGGWIKGKRIDIAVAGGHQVALNRGSFDRKVYIKKEVN